MKSTRQKLKIPPPEFYVLYNGGQHTPAEQVYKLSDHYTEKPKENSANVVVHFINICYSNNSEILNRSKTLKEYSLLMAYIDENINEGMERDTAIKVAVKRADDEKVLSEFLRKNASEVLGMLHGEVTMERYGEIRHEEGFEDGFELGCKEGKKEGRKEERLSIAGNFKNLNIPIADIAKATGLSEEEIEKL